jgi:hypothetical protein
MIAVKIITIMIKYTVLRFLPCDSGRELTIPAPAISFSPAFIGIDLIITPPLRKILSTKCDFVPKSAHYIGAFNKMNGVVTIDMCLNRDGSIDDGQRRVMEAAAQIMR